jgi:succinylarginine dihydrolase
MLNALKLKEVRPGWASHERYVLIETYENEMEGVFVDESLVSSDDVVHWLGNVGLIRRENGRILIELPQESTRGNWRIWVRAEDFGEAVSHDSDRSGNPRRAAV